MKVFKLYLKLLKKNLVTILIYVIIFIALAILFMSSSSESTTEFKESKVDITWINEDGDTDLLSNLKLYLGNYVEFVEVEKENIPDSLYFREIYMAITIPENFTTEFLNGKDIKFIIESVPDSVTNITIENAINKYLNMVIVYKEYLPEEDLINIYTEINKNLQEEITVTRTKASNPEFSFARTYYNILSYLIFVLNLTIVGMITIKLRRTDLKNRMNISPYSQSRINLEILLGNLLFTICFTSTMILISYLLYPVGMSVFSSFLYAINAIVFSFAILAISYCLSLLSKNEEVISALTNVIGLGSSFLTGAFVPQELLSNGVLAFAHIFPNYYYINNNESIYLLNDLNFNSLKKIILFLVIQLLFALVFVILSIVITTKQAKKEN